MTVGAPTTAHGAVTRRIVAQKMGFFEPGQERNDEETDSHPRFLRERNAQEVG
jgi:hypothetical protein